MARSGPLLTEAQWQKIAPLLPKPPKQRKGGRPWIPNRRVLEGLSVDSAGKGSLARLAGEVPTSLDLLAAAVGPGGAGRLVEHLPPPAGVSERVEQAPAIEVERVISGREFCAPRKKGLRSRKNKQERGTKWMVVVRRPRSSSGKLPSLCITGEVTPRGDARDTVRIRQRHHESRPQRNRS